MMVNLLVLFGVSGLPWLREVFKRWEEMAKRNARRRAPDVDQFRRHNLGWLLLRISQDFFRRVGPEFGRRGHQGMQNPHGTVLALLPLEGARITELARAAGVTKQAIAISIDELERLGYVERIKDPADGRAKIVRLSEAGLALLCDAQEIVEGVWDEYAEMVGPRELLALREGLDGLLEHIDVKRAEDRAG